MFFANWNVQVQVIKGATTCVGVQFRSNKMGYHVHMYYKWSNQYALHVFNNKMNLAKLPFCGVNTG